MTEFKKWCVFVLLLLLAVVTAAVSAEPATKEKAEMTFSSSWKVDISYPRLGTEAIDRRFRNWLEDHVNTTLSDVAVVSIDPDFEGQNWDMTVDCQPSRPSERVASVVVRTSTFPSRAAHPMSFIHVVNYDIETGQELRLSDIFALPDRALAIMAEKAPELANKAAADGIEDDDWFSEGFSAKPENYTALELTPDGIRIYFQLYQILPYVFGMTSIDMPRDMFEGAGPNLALWNK